MTVTLQLAVAVKQLEHCDCCGQELDAAPQMLARRESGTYDVLCRACSRYVMVAAFETASAVCAQDASKSP